MRPEGKEWLYEVKFDGYRCLAGRDEKRVTLWSRRENLFTALFPHIAHACERLPLDTLIDGEIVALDASGRVSFNLLQHHRSKAQALLFYVFDELVCSGRSFILCIPKDRGSLPIETDAYARRPVSRDHRENDQRIGFFSLMMKVE
jgi:bifunctional non-homologous end joining protein LigD